MVLDTLTMEEKDNDIYNSQHWLIYTQGTIWQKEKESNKYIQ